ncbi:MAG: DMT family transporter [Planctomycetes bacterium]|nr:DMT family transporter [Planctomycetota bacterium]
MSPSPLRVHGALITVSVLFGANYVFTKHILDGGVPAGSWVLFRMLAATTVLVPLALLLRRRSAGWPRPAAWLGLVVAALFGIVLNQILFTAGLAHTTPEHSAVINAGIPTWTLLVAVLAGQERLGWRRVLAIVLALGGVCWLLGVDRLLAGDGPSSADAARGDTVYGDLLTVANSIVFAVHLVLLRRLGRGIDPWLSTAVMFASGALMIGIWSGPAVAAADLVAVTTAPVLWFALYAVLFSTVLTYLLNTWALRHTHSSQVAIYINLQPLVAAALHTALGAPFPGGRFFGALALIAAGLWLQSRTRAS